MGDTALAGSVWLTAAVVYGGVPAPPVPLPEAAISKSPVGVIVPPLAAGTTSAVSSRFQSFATVQAIV